jgi:hypothetical protein
VAEKVDNCKVQILTQLIHPNRVRLNRGKGVRKMERTEYNPNRLLKMGKYDIPDNVYDENGIPNEVVNDMIDMYIRREPNIHMLITSYLLNVTLYDSSLSQQANNIVEFLMTIQSDRISNM